MKIENLKKFKPNQPIIIAIEGCGGSGKSTLAKELVGKLANSVLIERETFLEFMKKMDTTKETWDAKNFELDEIALQNEIAKSQDKSVIILEGLKTFEENNSPQK